MASAVLHRCRTPTNRLCACGRVARALARHGIEAEERRVAWRRAERAEVEELSGQRVVPVLELDGEVICDSRRILEHLEWRARERQRATSVDPAEPARR
jgi:glutathione S-transferase